MAPQLKLGGRRGSIKSGHIKCMWEQSLSGASLKPHCRKLSSFAESVVQA